jgi:CRP-like cAMP-binding protein
MTTEASGEVRNVDGRLELFDRVARFNYLSAPEKESLARLATIRQVPKGGDVYVERRPADSFAIVASGSVAKKGAGTRRAILPPSLIGTLPLLHRNARLRVRTTGLLALDDVVLVEVPYTALDQLPAERRDMFLDSVAEEAVFLIERLDRTLPTE